MPDPSLEPADTAIVVLEPQPTVAVRVQQPMADLPGGPVARTVHRGSYDGLAGAYDALNEWIHAQQGYDGGAAPWESYVDDPGAATDQAQIRTEINWPLVAV